MRSARTCGILPPPEPSRAPVVVSVAPSREIRVRRLALGAVAGLLLLPAMAPVAGATSSDVPTARTVAASRTWAPVDQATIRPGAQLVSETGGCTANFVYTSGADVFIGSAAHCTAEGTSVDGCANPSLPLGTPVQVEGAQRPATLFYSSWQTMQATGETDTNACRFNDLALLRLDPRDHERVNPTMPEWGGPLGLSDGASTGEDLYTYHQPDGGTRAKQGTIVAREGGGWTYEVRTGLDPGVPGDSGSGYLDETGRAFGLLSTIEFFPSALSNGATDLRMALDYARRSTGLEATLAVATEVFVPTGEAPPPPTADGGGTTVPVTRLQGADRYATAARVAATYANADAVVIATGVSPTDALAAGPAATGLEAPLLLAGPSSLSDAAMAQVERLDPEVAYIIGGERAVGPSVAQQLAAAGIRVERVFGADRYATAAAVAQRFGTPGSPLVVASGEGFADALSASPLASAQRGMLVLTAPTELPAATRTLMESWRPSAVQVVGGTGVIPDDRMREISTAARVEAGRIAGSDRYATGAAVASALFDADNFDFGGTIWVASGESFPDALAGGPAIDRERGLLLLVPRTGVLPPSVAAVADRTDGSRVTVLGGPAAVDDSMVMQVAESVAD